MDFLAGPQATALVRDSTARCAKEVLTAQPGGPTCASVEGDTALLRRGVRVRALYEHGVRTYPQANTYAQAVTEVGAELRTVCEVPGDVVILDRRTAFLLERDRSSGLLIREPCAVGYFCRVFEQLWCEGWAFPAPDPAMDPKPAILRMLGHGAKDETVARKLGISVRTCRRHIAEVMTVVEAMSRFQAGVMVTRRGLLGRPPE